MSKNLTKPSRWSKTMLSNHSIRVLRSICSQFGIKRYKSYRKDALIDVMIETYRQSSLNCQA